jgi:hypothetical protein
LPAVARSVRSSVNFSSAPRCSSALASWTFSPPRISVIALSIAPFTAPVSFRIVPSAPRSSQAASTKSSLEMNWSPRFCASLSVTFSRRPRSPETCTSPCVPSTVAVRPSWACSCERSSATLTPDLSSSGRTVPPSWSSIASIRCVGSMNWWSRPTASDWASASACWNLVVRRSLRTEGSGSGVCPVHEA